MKILLAEDDVQTADFVCEHLSAAGHVVIHTTSGTDALKKGLETGPDLLLLDRMLPGMDGLTLLKNLRAGGISAPALMLTALGGIEDRVNGLDAGADDYLVKPFAISELLARINALSRRHAHAGERLLQAGSVALDLLSREVRRNGLLIALQPREFRLLEVLARNVGKVVTRTMLLEAVWGFHFDTGTNIVETHMSRMRSKLNQGFVADPVETVRGEGYRMRTDV